MGLASEPTGHLLVHHQTDAPLVVDGYQGFGGFEQQPVPLFAFPERFFGLHPVGHVAQHAHQALKDAVRASDHRGDQFTPDHSAVLADVFQTPGAADIVAMSAAGFRFEPFSDPVAHHSDGSGD